MTGPLPALPAARGEGEQLHLILALAVVAVGCSETRGSSVDLRVAPLAWGGEQTLLAGDAAELDQFGCSVSLASDGGADRAVVGAFGESDGRGAAYVFVRSGDGWSEEQKLVASDGAEPDKFGASVSLGTDRVLVGAYGRTPLAARPTSSPRAATPGPKSKSWSRATGARARTSVTPSRLPATGPDRGVWKWRWSRRRLRFRQERQCLDRGAKARRERRSRRRRVRLVRLARRRPRAGGSPRK